MGPQTVSFIFDQSSLGENASQISALGEPEHRGINVRVAYDSAQQGLKELDRSAGRLHRRSPHKIVLVLHGSEQSRASVSTVEDSSVRVQVSSRKIARFLRSHRLLKSKKKDVQNISLVMCHGAAHRQRSFAAKLQGHLNRHNISSCVTAYTRTIRVTSGGEIVRVDGCKKRSFWINGSGEMVRVAPEELGKSFRAALLGNDEYELLFFIQTLPVRTLNKQLKIPFPRMTRKLSEGLMTLRRLCVERGIQLTEPALPAQPPRVRPPPVAPMRRGARTMTGLPEGTPLPPYVGED